MSFIPQSVIDEILSKLDIVDIAGKYIELKKSGENYKALCPFHSEKTPSFVISPSKQIFHCFGCGEGGNLIKFIMNIENINFIEAVKMLSKDAGIYIDFDEKLMDEEAKLAKKKSKMRNLLSIVSKIYEKELLKSDSVLSYLKERGLFREIISEFHIGFAMPGSILNSKEIKNQDIPLLIEAGVLQKDSRGKIFEKFRNRIIFPITDTRKNTIGFGGRILPGDIGAKYLNSPDSIIYKKGNTFYGMEQCMEWIRKTSSAILVEGYIDLIAMYKNGFKNVIAGLGTALTPTQVKILKRSAEDIYVLYDNDTAGITACLRAGELFAKHGVLVSVVKIKEKDPDDFFKRNDATLLKDIMKRKYSYLEYKVDFLNQKLDPSKVIDMEKISKNISIVLNEAKNISTIVYESLLKKWSKKYSIREELLKTKVPVPKKNKKILDERNSMNKIEGDVIKLLIENQELEEEIRKAGPKILDYFKDPISKEIIRVIQTSGVKTRWYEKLSEKSKDLFERISLSQSEMDINKKEHLEDCISKLREKHKKTQLSAIKDKIRQAGNRKDYDEVKRWQALYTKLKNE